MSKLTEKHHAFIVAKFYKELLKLFPENGKNTFIIATQRYAEQRGSRMAQRAIRDNKELNFLNYAKYGEWVYTDPNYINAEIYDVQKDRITKIFSCPWYDQFKAMNAIDCGKLYCTYLDEAIVRGFNPDLTYEVLKLIHDGEYCLHNQKNIGYSKDMKIVKEHTLSFGYHCGHVYKTFSDMVLSIYKSRGSIICTNVLEAFACEYGRGLADEVFSYRSYDFNIVL